MPTRGEVQAWLEYREPTAAERARTVPNRKNSTRSCREGTHARVYTVRYKNMGGTRHMWVGLTRPDGPEAAPWMYELVALDVAARLGLQLSNQAPGSVWHYVVRAGTVLPRDVVREIDLVYERHLGSN